MCTRNDKEGQLNACLDNVAGHIAHLRGLDLSVEGELEQALEQSRKVMGTLAMYRGLLERRERQAAWRLPCAA